MFDTYVTVVGNVLTTPEWRRTTQSGTLVANFKVASTARRLDRETGRWVDGNSLRVRVNCWRKLAEGVASSVMVGDPIVVVGRMYTRDWIDDAGNHRTLYELEAVAVGHDLSRGRARFARNRSNLATSSIEDPEATARVRGETTEPVSEEEAPARRDDRPFDDESDFPNFPIPAAAGDEAGPGAPIDGSDDQPEPDHQPGDELDGRHAELGVGTAGDLVEPAGDEREAEVSDGDGAAEETGDAGRFGVRGRRGRNRVPVPA